MDLLEKYFDSFKELYNVYDLLGIITIDAKLFDISVYDIWGKGYEPKINLINDKLFIECEHISHTKERDKIVTMRSEINKFNIVKYSNCNTCVTLENEKCRQLLDVMSTNNKYAILYILSDGIVY